MNYAELYRYGVEKLEASHVPEAALDARLLLEWVCGTKRHDLLANGDREVADCEYDSYRECIARRKSREPLQYITGEQEFMGLVFQVNDSVLIPRQDTEVLVEEVMRYLHDGMEILDMCTGSGCILLSLLHYSNSCKGLGIDISEDALLVARKNAERLSQEGASFIQSDLFENVQGKYDIIVSNPPYIRTEDIQGLMEEVRDFEPMGALDGSGDGMLFYDRIISHSRKYLHFGGFLFFEIGCDQAVKVSERMEKCGYSDIRCVKDFAGLDRVVLGCYR